MTSHGRTLWAVADLHASVRENRVRLAELVPDHPDDWLILAGDVAERTAVVVEVLSELNSRYATVIWVPGNHELYSAGGSDAAGKAKYRELVAALQRIGVITPEDNYPAFGGVTIVPLFLLYDHSFRPPGTTVAEALQRARARQVVMTDDAAIAPFVNVGAWCRERLAYSARRLSHTRGETVLVNHWPLIQEPTLQLALPELALWCGTRHTRDWARRYHARCVVYGHLHIPGTVTHEGIAHHEVSLGYPREWRRRKSRPAWPYPVLREGERA